MCLAKLNSNVILLLEKRDNKMSTCTLRKNLFDI